MITVLFGAGASYPFYDTHLSTSYLTEQVQSRRNWERMQSKYEELNVGNNVIPDLQYVTDILQSTLNSELHFEQLAEIIDKIYSVTFDAIPQNNMLNRILYNLGIRIRHINQSQYIPFFFREIIANAIIDSEDNHKVPNYAKLQRSQQEFLQQLSNIGERVSIVSLNYDDCIPNSIDNLSDYKYCFDNHHEYYGNMLNVKRFLNVKKVAYFPHGHLRFVFNDQENVSYVPDIHEAETKRWEGLFYQRTGIMTNSTFCYDFNTFITTGQTKDIALNSMPYAVYYQRLAMDFLLSDMVILIGYSFNDSHFNRLLKGFLFKNDTNKVLIVDKNIQPITMTEEYKDPNNIIAKIQNTFGPEWRIRVNEYGEKLPFKPEEINRINQEGFGEIFDRIFYYTKGYEEFLNNSETVLALT